METKSKDTINIFLCHSSDDKPLVRQLYKSLIKEKFNAWLDEENILPGQDWETEIARAVKKADIIIICLSQGSINKSGYIQKEIKFALSVAEEKPDGVIFIIPARLEECEVPDKLRKWQWVDLFHPNGYQRLLHSLYTNLSQKEKTLEYSKEFGTNIQSGLASRPSVFIPFPDTELANQPPQQLTVIIRATGERESEKRRIKAIFGTLISFHGKDRFSFQVFEKGMAHLIDFPNETTRVCEDLIVRLKKFLNTDSDFRIDPFKSS